MYVVSIPNVDPECLEKLLNDTKKQGKAQNKKPTLRDLQMEQIRVNMETAKTFKEGFAALAGALAMSINQSQSQHFNVNSNNLINNNGKENNNIVSLAASTDNKEKQSNNVTE